MVLRRGKRGKLGLVWLGLAQTDLPAMGSMAHLFLVLQRCSLATTITDPGVVVVATNKDGWMTASTTDPDIDLNIK